MRRLILFAACLVLSAPAAFADEEEPLPAGFRFVGNYQFEKRIKIRDGAALSIVTKPFVCRIYTDGITVRVYGEGNVNGHTAFAIYRNDGVTVRSGSQGMETIPGVQAQSVVGSVMRQLTLTREQLVLTKFPALSDVVEITYANRRVTIGRNEPRRTTRK